MKPDDNNNKEKNKFKDEYDEFVNIIKNFALRVPIKQKPDFNGLYKFIFARSIGCVGILKVWLFEALRKALYNGEEVITKDYLEMTALEN